MKESTGKILSERLSAHPSLKINFSWTFAGNVVYAACQWGMLIVLTRMGAALVGQFALGLAITAPIIMFGDLQLRAVQYTDVHAEDYCFGHYLALRIISNSLALLIISCIALVGGYRWETATVIIQLGIAKVFESFSDICYGVFQQHEMMSIVSKSLFLRGTLALLGLGLGTHMTGTVFGGVFGLSLAWLLVLILYDFRNATRVLKFICPTHPALAGIPFAPSGNFINSGHWRGLQPLLDSFK